MKQHGTPFPIWISLLNANLAWYNRESYVSWCWCRQADLILFCSLDNLSFSCTTQSWCRYDFFTAAVLWEADVDTSKRSSSVKCIILHARICDGCSSGNSSCHITSANGSFLICWTCGICGVISMTQDLRLWLYSWGLHIHTHLWP